MSAHPELPKGTLFGGMGGVNKDYVGSYGAFFPHHPSSLTIDTAPPAELHGHGSDPADAGGAHSGKSETVNDALLLHNPAAAAAAPVPASVQLTPDHEAPFNDAATTGSPSPAEPAPLPPPDASEGPEAAAEYEAYLQRWDAGVTLAQRWQRLAANGKLDDIREDWEDWQLDLMLAQVRSRTQAAVSHQGKASQAAGYGSSGSGLILSTRLRRRVEAEEAADSPSEEPRRVRSRRAPSTLQDYQLDPANATNTTKGSDAAHEVLDPAAAAAAPAPAAALHPMQQHYMQQHQPQPQHLAPPAAQPGPEPHSEESTDEAADNIASHVMQQHQQHQQLHQSYHPAPEQAAAMAAQQYYQEQQQQQQYAQVVQPPPPQQQQQVSRPQARRGPPPQQPQKRIVTRVQRSNVAPQQQQQQSRQFNRVITPYNPQLHQQQAHAQAQQQAMLMQQMSDQQQMAAAAAMAGISPEMLEEFYKMGSRLGAAFGSSEPSDPAGGLAQNPAAMAAFMHALHYYGANPAALAQQVAGPQ